MGRGCVEVRRCRDGLGGMEGNAGVALGKNIFFPEESKAGIELSRNCFMSQ